uniref:Uncharacterized protein n=1 Tax=Arundo donax TaxID=35708 RepID=A0A0A8YF82_ARUDO
MHFPNYKRLRATIRRTRQE